MNYIDIHSHINFPDYDQDREETFKRARDAGVGMIIVGTDVESSKKAVELAETHENVWATVGVHPTDIKEPIDFSLLEELALDQKVVAIGECGLDYFRSKPEDVPGQRNVFEKHIALSNKVCKPLMLHVRNDKTGISAYQEAVEMLKKHAKVRANFHFFAGNQSDLASILEINGTVSFTGVLTFTEDYDQLVRNVPLTSVMIETDCPFVAPAPYRGKRNEPAYAIEVVKAIARIRGDNEQKVAAALLENARKFFQPTIIS